MQEDTIKILVNKQLEPHKKTFDEVWNKPQWFLNYKTTKEEQSEFMDWGVNFLMENNKVSRKLAEIEISWFILSWGLTLNNTEKEKV